MTTDVQLSKSLSWLLRHGAVKEGLEFDAGGFIDVNMILNLKQFHKYTIDDIIRVVNNNEKKRFTLRAKNNDPKQLQIRANQGHSLPLEEEGLLVLLSETTVPPIVYHGTYSSSIESIRKRGLSRMKRNHIHFTAALPGTREIVSGMRSDCDVIVSVNALKAMKDGFKFYKSDNEVILCPGNEHGLIPALYFEDIYINKTNQSLKLV